MFDYMIMPLKRYFDFQGRSRRMEYWSFVLFTILLYLVPFALMMMGGLSLGALSGDPGMAEPQLGIMFWLGAGIFGLIALALVIPGIAVIVRRFHDRDMSGWWYLGLIVASMIPFVGFIASIALIVFMLLPGTPGPNRFGPDPKDPASVAVFE